MKIKWSFFFFLFFSFQGLVFTQHLPFWSEIQAFKKQDSIDQPWQGQIVFTGSSTIRLWKALDKDFPGFTILNRGFGGSTLPDLIEYIDLVVIRYHPMQVVIYCGENDLAADSTVTGKTVFERFKTLQKIIHGILPRSNIVFISLKLSPSRAHLFDKVVDANKRIKKFIKRKSYLTYVDIVPPMLNAEGKPREELFLADRLHMNEKGYTIWKTVLAPYLIK
ncbi:MAG: GDSL-type esterase/lipase family protein [Saprospiraceae bacterium]|nr:GDSL-type esterase/lipase family protein [Saprospiraceae bacterium]